MSCALQFHLEQPSGLKTQRTPTPNVWLKISAHFALAAPVLLQRPELRYVPKNWGHAILNTRTSIGFAGEFRIVKNLPSPADIQGGHSWVGKDAQRSLMLMSEGFSARAKLHKNYLSLET